LETRVANPGWQLPTSSPSGSRPLTPKLSDWPIRSANTDRQT